MPRAITGRSVTEVTEQGWPGRLSTNGFMCEDEDVISVLKGDNRLVGGLGLTHAAIARPLLHVCNMIQADWEHNHYPLSRGASTFLYNGRKIHADLRSVRPPPRGAPVIDGLAIVARLSMDIDA